MGPLGTVWTIPVAVITGNATFDYFWTLTVVLGLVSWSISAVIRIIARS
jgi:hypothetical protein